MSPISNEGILHEFIEIPSSSETSEICLESQCQDFQLHFIGNFSKSPRSSLCPSLKESSSPKETLHEKISSDLYSSLKSKIHLKLRTRLLVFILQATLVETNLMTHLFHQLKSMRTLIQNLHLKPCFNLRLRI